MCPPLTPEAVGCAHNSLRVGGSPHRRHNSDEGSCVAHGMPLCLSCRHRNTWTCVNGALQNTFMMWVPHICRLIRVAYARNKPMDWCFVAHFQPSCAVRGGRPPSVRP
jgi:hypothetical protein